MFGNLPLIRGMPLGKFLYLDGFQLYFEDLICMYVGVYSHCINHLQGPVLADTADSNWISFNKEGAGFMNTSKACSSCLGIVAEGDVTKFKPQEQIRESGKVLSDRSCGLQ